MREHFGLVLGGVVALILQVALAPNAAIFGAQPNFVLVYLIAVSLFNRSDAVTLLAFVLGLAFDSVSMQPFGLMAALALIATFVASRAFRLLDNDSVLVSIAVSMLCAVVVECAYAATYVLLGADVSFGSALVGRALPCALYDCAMTLLFIPLLHHALMGRSERPGKALHVSSSSTTISNIR